MTLLALGLSIVAVVWTQRSPSSRRQNAEPSTHTGQSVTSTTSPPSSTIPPGRLPQTADEPGFGPQLTTPMRVLFDAIVNDSPQRGHTAFFPKAAYISMKEGIIADPSRDYEDRLVAFFNLDLGAYQAALGDPPTAAHLTAINADQSLAQWIAPGTCENSVGYWHLPGTRLVYSVNGAVHSFRVASLISWRGHWYVIHLGPNPRPANVGTVDDPQDAAGVPGPGGGC